MIWVNLVHLSYNMWIDHDAPELEGYGKIIIAQPNLRFDKAVYDDILKAMVENGANMLVIDLGDAVKYESHPEIAVNGAWSVEQLRSELARIRKIGIEPIPKLNFSATHDIWMGPYSRMLSTPQYYDVCRDLISEVIDIFDNPRLFHIGMDEETYGHQIYQKYVVIRQYDLWWHDLLFYVKEVEKKGVQSWMWSDYEWHHPELFFKNMPKSVLQSNWYYDPDMYPEEEPNKTYVKAYLDLEKHGYDQVPTGSNHSTPVNFEETVKFCKEHIAPERLKGFLQTVWRPTVEEYRQRQIEAVEQIGRGKKIFEG